MKWLVFVVLSFQFVSLHAADAPKNLISVKIVTRVKTENAKSLYERSSADEKWAKLIQAKASVVQTTEVTADGSEPQKEERRLEVDSGSAGEEDSRSFSNAKVESVGKTLYLVLDEKKFLKASDWSDSESTENATDKEAGKEQELKISYRLPLELVNGSLEDFEAGKTVELKLSEKGKKDFVEQMKTQANETLQKQMKYAKDKGGKASVEVTIDEKSSTKIFASLDRIELQQMPYTVVLTITTQTQLEK